MSERDGFPTGVPCWVTNLQPDPDAAARFYGGLFGWDYVDGGGFHVARLGDRDVAAVAPQPTGMDPSQAAWITTVRVGSADDTARRAAEAGGSVLAEPFDGPSGRMTVIADPAGAVLSACEHGPGGSAELVNEPGAWSMSQLQTPDPEGAKAFYGAVFGWTTEDFTMGEVTATMFRLPGYVGGEPEQPVSREVVATMIPGEAAVWSVDFWVHDVDEVAAKAHELDGRAVVAPFDMPIGRTAVLTDPAGATFSVSRVSARA